jgi:Ca-activated chloride channel homolog
MIFASAAVMEPVMRSQVDASADPYKLKLPVDEVVLTFHAADARGLPVNDLKLSDLELLDNGRHPRTVVAFDSMLDFPIRTGILMDTSESMASAIEANRKIAIEYAQRMFREKTDQAFVMDFGYVSNIRQNWTSDPAVLSANINLVKEGKSNPRDGTALFDAIFRACSYQFGEVDHAASSNFILLFSDGEDNASHGSLAEAVNACERSNTAIYAFHLPAAAGSSGPRTLAQLADQTGGRVFHGDDAGVEIEEDLRFIEANMRNQYRIAYKPAELKHDGAFHEIELVGPDRVKSITVRSGYYAPAH